MTGDLADIISRLRVVLPKCWFADQSPNLAAVLQGIATPWVWLYNLITYTICQTRLSTATDNWLDLIASDFFDDLLARKFQESDAVYRARIQAALLRGAATRAAVSSGLEALVGSPPFIFEPSNCMDTGSYGTLSMDGQTGLAYGQTGGWGSLALPLQFFVTTTRPPTSGISLLGGYGTPNGGYGEGATSYFDLSLLPGRVTDQDIQETLCGLLPVTAVAWLRIN